MPESVMMIGGILRGSIQFPAVRYLGYAIARCILPRDNTSNTTSLDLAIHAAAINCDETYNIGALIARRLSTNKVRGPISGGIIASIMLATAMLPPREDDLELDFIRLDLAAMKSHHFVTYDSTLENLQYRLLFAFELDNPRLVRLPAPVLFNSVSRDGYSFPKEVLDEYLASLAPEEEPEQEPRDLQWQPQMGANWGVPPPW